jgi:phosphoglycerate dehydrogenase-like enzyme
VNHDSMNVLIASPLEPEFVERVRAVDGVDVLYAPELLPRARYPNDHGGEPVALDSAGEARWNALLERAQAIFGYPLETSASLARVLERGPNIVFVQGTSAGMGAHVKRANLPQAVLRRVAFASAAGVHAGMLAEYALYGLLAIRKDAHRLARLRAQRRWEHFALGELDASTLGILGMGQIGGALAVRARAFGMTVVGFNRSGSAASNADETYPTSSLRTVASRLDALAITLPMTDRTTGMVSADIIAALRPNAVVINVGRGSVVDEAALVAALAGGRIAGAVLDVFATEPLPPDSPLWTMPNVVMSPHTAALSMRENARIVDLFIDNLGRLARGEQLRNALNLSEFY